MKWTTQNGRMIRTFKMESFSAIINRLEALAIIANEAEHHPDFHVKNYNEIAFELYTHDSHSITEKDHSLAVEIDKLFEINE